MDRADIHRAALRQFATKGYHATTVRDLAADLAVTPPAIYHHFRNKDEVLTSLIEDIVNQDLAMLRTIQERSSSQAETSPLDAVLFAHVYGMCVGREETLVVDRESKSLTAEFARRVALVMGEYRSSVAHVVAVEYHLTGADLEIATRAALGLGTSVTAWFDPAGTFGARELAVRFVGYARALLAEAQRQARGSSAPSGDSSFDADGFGDVIALIDELIEFRRRPVNVR